MSTTAILSALLASGSWAVASIAIGRVLTGGLVSPAAANLFKNSAAAFAFFLAALVMGGRWPVGEAWAWLFLSGFLGFAVGDTLYFAAIRRCGVQTAATVILLNVPIATLLAVPLAGDDLRTQVVPFMVVVLVGVVLVTVDSRRAGGVAPRRGTEGSYAMGVLLAMVAAFAIGAAVPIGRGRFSDVSVCPGGFIRLVGGAAGAIPMAFLTGLGQRAGPGRQLSRLIEPIFAAPGPGSIWSKASLFGVGCAVLGLLPYHYALRELPSGVASTLFAATPLFTLPIALLLGGRFGWKSILGTLVGFFGVAGILYRGEDRAAANTAVPAMVPIAIEVPLGTDGGRRPSFVRTRRKRRTLPKSVAEALEIAREARWKAPRVAPSGQELVGDRRVPPDPTGAALGPGSRTLVSEPLIAIAKTAALPGAAPTDQVPRPVLIGGADPSLPSGRFLLSEARAPATVRGHWADVPLAVRLDSGALLIGTFQSLGDELHEYGVRLAMEIDGPPALDIGWLHDDPSAELHGFADGLPSASGGAHLIWVDDRDGDGEQGMALYQRELFADGTLGHEKIVDHSLCDCCPPALEQLADGTLIAAFRHRSAEDIRDIYLARRDPAGGTWGAPAPVANDGWELAGCPVNGPAMAVAGEVVAVAWFTQAGDEDVPRIQLAFSENGGKSFSKPSTVVRGRTLGRVAIEFCGEGGSTDTGDQGSFLLAHLALNDPDEEAEADASWRVAVVSMDRPASPFVRVADVDGLRPSGRIDLVRVRGEERVIQAVWSGPVGLETVRVVCPGSAVEEDPGTNSPAGF